MLKITPHSLGLFENQKLVSILSFEKKNFKKQEVIYVDGVYTSPDSRGKGYSGTLIVHLKEKIYKSQYTIIVYVDKDNIVAIKAYEKIGMKYTDSDHPKKYIMFLGNLI